MASRSWWSSVGGKGSIATIVDCMASVGGGDDGGGGGGAACSFAAGGLIIRTSTIPPLGIRNTA